MKNLKNLFFLSALVMFLGVFTACEDDCPDCTGLDADMQAEWDMLDPDFCNLTDEEELVWSGLCALDGGTWE